MTETLCFPLGYQPRVFFYIYLPLTIFDSSDLNAFRLSAMCLMPYS